MRSYFGATESKTPRTRARLLALVDLLEAEMGFAHDGYRPTRSVIPRWVRPGRLSAGCPLRNAVMMVAAAPAAASAGIGASRSTPASRQAPLVAAPQLVLLRAEEIQVVPGEDAGVVAVGEASAGRRSCRPAPARPGRPRACRSAALPGPGRGPAPRPRASRRASARRGCGTSRRRRSATSRHAGLLVHRDVAREFEGGRPGGLETGHGDPRASHVRGRWHVYVPKPPPATACLGLARSVRPARARCRRRWRAPRSRASSPRRGCVGHLDHDVVGLEQAVLQVAGSATGPAGSSGRR